ncbi:hypothetical protein PF005_g27966 [Phytophthora fragariae]|uniref:Uncharacterized protein n=1 Tax=Phytophthora fragariae TaxID=53985 RepID=A0A6A3YIK4_9STRA|nr:hypothetical protein PF003_g33888 [Phytophthora fragariae]KAE8936945.1 hypothetical protein PF009_g13132 [Phytophthora fragariae]KAE9067348.1 hypothetical protein PF007_g28105 [Phytophthora fragariae]KAE9080119.1 hypothetical protein PF006_g27379 [Phytophthora fragariae]KAE9169446.1 hypothetical protein PF005_g27966 [Phytophthora fragariae]
MNSSRLRSICKTASRWMNLLASSFFLSVSCKTRNSHTGGTAHRPSAPMTGRVRKVRPTERPVGGGGEKLRPATKPQVVNGGALYSTVYPNSPLVALLQGGVL